MKLRSLPLAVAAAAAVIIPTLGWTPAFADVPASPGLTIDSPPVAGTVSGTVSSSDLQPFVLVALVAESDTGEPNRTVVTLADSNTFSFPSWGYGANTTVQAWACPTNTYDVNACSVATVSDAFTPADVAVTPTFSPDPTIGPADDVSVDLGTPGDTGGGVLIGRWIDGQPNPLAAFSVAKTDATTVPVRDGTGTVHVYRCDNVNQDHCVEEAVSNPYTVKQADPTATIGTVTAVSSDNPTTTFNVTTSGAGNGNGTYSISWHLEQGGNPVDGFSGTPTGSLTAGVAQNVPLDATDLPAGDYAIVGTITVVDPAYGAYPAVDMTGGMLHSSGDITPPAITSIVAAPTKIYPLISGNSTYKNTATITVTGAGVGEVGVLRIYQQSTNTLVRTRTLTVNGSTGTTTWDGRRSTGEAVPSGIYLLKVRDSAGNFSATVGTLAVSGYKLVTKTWTHTYTPAGTLADSYVGSCSTLRKPSLRGWYNSLGYYANTRCTSQTSKDSLVSTLHAIFLPSKGVVQYVDIRVNAYGGAARAKPGSKAVIRYLKTNGDWSSDKPVSSTLGTHAGYTRSTSSLVFKDHSFGWGFYTGFGYQYDVKSFTVVLHYKALG